MHTNFRNKPLNIALKANTRYALCLCGDSKTFPMCNGAHKKTGKKPFKFTLEKNKNINLCQCGKSQALPHCDGSHLHD